MTGVIMDIIMKIWRNDKRVVKASRYTYCADCCLNYIFLDKSRSVCLATHFNIQSDFKVCFRGYKYETDV